MIADSSRDATRSPQTHNLLLRELISGGLLAGGLFWAGLSLLLFITGQMAAPAAGLARISDTLSRALSGAEIHNGFLVLLFASGIMMLWQSRALIHRTPRVSSLFIPGVVALGLQIFSVMSGAVWTSGIFAALIAVGLGLSYFWTAAYRDNVSQHENAAFQYMEPDQAGTEEIVKPGTAVDFGKKDEDDAPTVAELTANRDEPVLASVTSLNTHREEHEDLQNATAPISGVSVDEPELETPAAAEDRIVEGLSFSRNWSTTEQVEKNEPEEATPLASMADETPTVIESCDDLMPPSAVSEKAKSKLEDTQEMRVEDSQALDAPENAVFDPLAVNDEFEIPKLETTMEINVPLSDLLVDPKDGDEQGNEPLQEMDKTMVLDRPVFFDKVDNTK